MDIQSIRKNSAVITAGAWVKDIPGLGDAELKVRGLSSPTVRALRARKEREASDSDRDEDGSLKLEASRRVLCEVLHEAVLIDWRGLTDGGKPVPYCVDAAAIWLLDPDYEQFQDWCIWAARKVDADNTGAQAALEKNSAAPSSGA